MNRMDTATTVNDEEKGGDSTAMADLPGSNTFVDYVAPKKSIPPPAKWKLAFLIFTGVYFSVWFQSEAGFVPWMIQKLRLRPDGALFLFLWIAVGCLSYGYLDVINYFAGVNIKREWYGVTTWLKRPRTRWVHEYQNFVVVCIRIVVTILEDGFSIVDVASPATAPPSKDAAFEHTHSNEPVILRIEQHIKKGKVPEYEAIRDRLGEALELKTNPGVLHTEATSSRSSGLCVFTITFRNIAELNDFMESPIRLRWGRQIKPLLETPTTIQLVQERDLPDAFTDLVTQQGQDVPHRSPKKWKVWFLSTLSIYLVVLFTNHTLPDYLNAWKLADKHPRIQTLVTIAINVFLNAYLMTPLITKAFGEWLVRPLHDEEGDRREPWRTLNDGFRTIWGKLVMCILFYGGLAIAWIV